MKALAYFRINYKSDFILTLNSDAGWMTPFCIKFWTGAPSKAYFAGWDGTTYTHCTYDPSEPTKLVVQFDDHHLPIGDLKFQIAYHFTVADFPNDVEDEVLNQSNIVTEIDGNAYQVMLDFTGETAPEIQFSLPAYANEAQRIANEEQRIAHEAIRIVNEESRIAAETIRQQNEAQRIAQETARVNEFATLKSQSQAATRDANDAATLANQKAQLAADKAALADAAATLANEKAQLAADKAALANAAAQLANEKAALAQQKAEYAQAQGSYAKDQGDYAKSQGDYAKEQGDTALADHQRAEADHGIAVDDHTLAGNDHIRAESDHGIAVDDHTQAGNDHTRAESDHGIAVDDHTQAGNDHTRAESDHGIAADDHTLAGNDHTRAEADHTRAESDHSAVELYVDSLGVFDLSKHNAVGGVLATYADLSAALTALNALGSQYKYGGMSFKFVRTSDNKYVQARCMAQNFTTDVTQWQVVDKLPTPNSKNFVESGGVVDSFGVNGYFQVESGGISVSGNDMSNNKRARTTYFKIPVGSKITLDSSIVGKMSVSEYAAKGDQAKTAGSPTWISSNTYITSTSEWIRVTFKYDVDRVIPDAEFESIKNAITIDALYTIKSRLYTSEADITSLSAIDKELGYFTIESGTVNNFGNNDSAANRARFKSCCKLQVGAKVSCTGYKVAIHYYDSIDGTTHTSYTDWVDSIVLTSSYVRIVFKKNDDSTITEQDLETIKNTLKIESAESIKESEDFATVTDTISQINNNISSIEQTIDDEILEDVIVNYDTDDFVKNQHYIGLDGSVNESSTANCQRLVIELEPNTNYDKITATLSSVDNKALAIAFYNANEISAENFISGVTLISGTKNYDLPIPNNAAMIVVSNRYASNNNPVVALYRKSIKGFNELSEDVEELQATTQQQQTSINQLESDVEELNYPNVLDWYVNDIANNLRIGNIVLSGGVIQWKSQYSNRVTTAENYFMHLKKDTVISFNTTGLTDMIIFWKDTNGVSKESGWVSKNGYTTLEDGDYAFMVRTTTDMNLVAEAFSLSYLHDKIKTIENELAETKEDVDELSEDIYGSGTNTYYGNKISFDIKNQPKKMTYNQIYTETYGEGNIRIQLQSHVIYNGIMFVFLNGTAGCSVYDVSDMSNVTLIETIQSPVNAHFNNSQFSNIFYDANDEFPLILLSSGNEGTINSFYWTRIQYIDGHYTLTIIKEVTCTVDFYGHCFVANFISKRMFLYCSKYNFRVTEDNRNYIFEIPFIGPDSEITTIGNNDIITKIFDVDRIIWQGACEFGGKLFFPVEHLIKVNGIPYTGGARSIIVVDECTGNIETTIPITSVEPEGLCLYNQKLYLTQRNGGTNHQPDDVVFILTEISF